MSCTAIEIQLVVYITVQKLGHSMTGPKQGETVWSGIPNERLSCFRVHVQYMIVLSPLQKSIMATTMNTSTTSCDGDWVDSEPNKVIFGVPPLDSLEGVLFTLHIILR